ncbi:glycoside hydrolase family 43 protein [uncultured Serinicoccus sp.]|uniref:glycoside hydrolase family 43 protein n=1 Tax=uncultured Serinicoccus sp. TaxID=735514 RepID=UPI002631A98B|nr:glycoside hydrolase family 43 protein [uncultured Serinicoccus sp.]
MRRRTRRAAGIPLVLLVLAGCAGGGGAGQDAATQQTTDQTTESEADDVAAGTGFTNPVHPTNFPDPHILADEDGGYIAFATNGNAMNVQTAVSEDMVDWSQGSDALPRLPGWSTPGKVWAPETIRWADGSYRMYYTTALTGEDRQCISVAVADQAAGPYVDDSDEPLLCEIEEGGSIDTSPFVASDGTAYLYWKNDGNHVGVDTFIRVARLSEDGMTVEGETVDVLQQDQPWEDMLVEGPSVWEHEGRFHLFYSGNGFWTEAYAVGHAVSDSPTGPFTKDPEPVLVANEVAAGPGHNSLVEVDGQLWMVYHAWVPGSVGDEAVGRQMWLSRVTFTADGGVEVEPPAVDHPVAPEAGR